MDEKQVDMQSNDEEVKKQKFLANPDSFVCLDELVVAVRRTDKGLSHYIGQSKRIELEAALSRLQYNVFKAFDEMSIAKASSEIIMTNGRIKEPGKVVWPPFK